MLLPRRPTGLALLLVILYLLSGYAIIPPAHAQPGILYVSPGESIQAAVDAASPGDTIIVNPGTYAESVLIQKSLKLLGVDRNTTIIQTPDRFDSINITATQDVVVANFSITIGSTLRDSVYIQDSANVTITDCTLTDSIYGVLIQGGSKNRVENNLMTGNEIGVGIWNSANATIRNNVISGSPSLGVEIIGGTGHQLVDNEISQNLAAVEISSSTRNLVHDNTLTGGADGIDVRANSTNNNVTRNQLSKFANFALRILDSGNNRILENLISDNHSTSNDALGVQLQNATGNSFLRNSLVRNDAHLFAICSTVSPGCPQSDVTANSWDDGTRGNFWDNYVDAGGADTDGDGIGDTLLPFPCPNGGQPCSTSGPPGVDNKPLMVPWQPPALLVLLHTSPKTGYAPLRVVFTSSASGGQPPYSFQWVFGDGMSNTGQNTTHSYSSAGTFNVALTVTDAAGSLANANATVTVLQLQVSFLPLLAYLAGGGAVVATIAVATWYERRRKAARRSELAKQGHLRGAFRR